ncbi:F0F1 ATP synthase subunit gamma [Candidatus Tachikawaea gelatinosa]|uniref:ATP synthase gamma chain n=1 Tax=Candidatus Tachikawaea gelatinosa TaxID=1410383 RepID=A0A090AR77_9ENTR|nr:F0F1 ATP synthase subunit gamma [Candidatus Tachikawaea gelatinosa]BAP58270.1 ATP synthase subunit gamma [Candidatus Tachikawaea gelatinosa]
MSDVKEIRKKIQSINNTKKITKAMQMVSSAKMRKAKERMISSRPYSEAMIKVINNLALGNLEYKNVYLEKRKIKSVGYIIISTDRGLCGNLNSLLFRTILENIKNFTTKKITIKIAVIGSKAFSFFSTFCKDIVTKTIGIGDDPSIIQLIGSIKTMLKLYEEKKIDQLYIANNKFVSTLSQIPVITKLLPLPESKKNNFNKKNWDYIYEPNPKILLNILLQRYIESQVYQNVLENLASEQAARMISMKSATDNGEKIVQEMQFIYNKIRQASITQELNEIIAGFL